MITVIIVKSHRRDKKFDAIVNWDKIISFGAKGYEDYTIHKDEERKERYISRHRKMKIGKILTQQVFIRDGYFGIKRLFKVL